MAANSEVATHARCLKMEALSAVETIHRAKREKILGGASVAMDREVVCIGCECREVAKDLRLEDYQLILPV